MAVMETQLVPSLSGRRYVIVADTDGHGVTLGAAVLRALLSSVPEDQIAVISHFDPKGPATTARGDVTALIRQIAASIPQGSTVYFLDVPIKIDDAPNQIAAIMDLSTKAKVVIIDHATHSSLYAGMPALTSSELDLRLKINAMDTFTDALLQSPSLEVYDLAVAGAVMDMDLESFRGGTASTLASIVSAAGEADVKVPTVDDVKANYPAFKALDDFIKRGKVHVDTGALLVGNMAPKVAYFASKPLSEIFTEALQQFPTPDLDAIAADTEVVDGIIARYRPVVPRGQGFKYASLVDATSDAPVNLVVSEGFDPSKLIVIVTHESFNADAPQAASFTRHVRDLLYDKLRAAGISGDDDFPRGDSAFSLGIAADRVDEALTIIADAIKSEYTKYFKEKILERVVAEEFTVLTADPALAASMARIVSEAVRTAVQMLKE